MAEWSVLTNHARVLMYIAKVPCMTQRDIAQTVDASERAGKSERGPVG